MKSLRHFSAVLNVKQKLTFVESDILKKIKAIQTGSTLCSRINKRRGHTKIIKIVKNALYNWVLHYPQVVQYPIVNG